MASWCPKLCQLPCDHRRQGLKDIRPDRAYAVLDYEALRRFYNSTDPNTLADVENYLTYAAGLIVGSGVCAMITVVCIALRKMWIVAVIACLISAMLCFWSVFGLLIGLLVAWQIFRSKDIFTEDA